MIFQKYIKFQNFVLNFTCPNLFSLIFVLCNTRQICKQITQVIRRKLTRQPNTRTLEVKLEVIGPKCVIKR